MRIVVLGAGLIGVTSAWFLAEDGHEVIVVDRQPGPARETSFANGGQISASHAVPWANPAAPLKILEWLGREEAPLLWRLRADPAQWAWGLRFLRECSPQRTRANIRAILALALDSRARLKHLRRQLDLAYDCLECGILHFYTDRGEFSRAISQAAQMREFGCERIAKTTEECLAIEPALANARVPIVGGTFTAGDESGDARQFAAQLAERAAMRGVGFRFDTPVAGIEVANGRFAAVRLCGEERLAADACVVALGSYAAPFLRPLGIRIPVYPAKGYSVTLPLPDDAAGPRTSLIDDGEKLVYSRLGRRLRVAGTAEFSGYDTRVNPARIELLLRRVRTIFPDLPADAAEAEPWTGLRPATPGNVPLIGATRMPGVFLNAGHGTLGWTMAAGSGRLLADLVSRKTPAIDARPYAPTGC